MPRVVVHCGLHKTGTTALQQFMLAIAPSLHKQGILYPRAGRLDHWGGGHHNIAWQLTHDRRYDRIWGTLDDLLNEIAAFAGDVVLSSEDFETCLGAPWLFAPLLHDSRLGGREVVFVIYLRDQISYAEGQYSENLGHHIGDECLAVMRELLQRREWRLHEWRYQFDYAQIARRMQAVVAAPVIFRSYTDLVGNSVVSDFIRVLSPATVLDADSLPRTNKRWLLPEALAMFYFARVDRALTDAETAAIRLAAAQPAHRLVLATGIRQALARTFGPSNTAFCRQVGWPRESLDLESRVTLPHGRCLFSDRVFSFATQVAIAGLAGLLPEAVVRQPDAVHPLPGAVRAALEDLAADWGRDDCEP